MSNEVIFKVKYFDSKTNSKASTRAFFKLDYIANKGEIIDGQLHGAFSNDGQTQNLLNRQVRLKDFISKGGIVYDGIISFKNSEMLEDLGINDIPNGFKGYVNEHIYKVGSILNIPPEKLTYIASVHLDNDHPHIHILFNNEDIKSRKAHLNKTKIEDVTKYLSKPFNLEIGIKIEGKNIEKTKFNSIAKSEVDILMNLLNGDGPLKNEKIPSQEYENEMNNRINNLYNKLPEKGRLAYGYLDEKTKLEVLKLTRYMINNSIVLSQSFKKSLDLNYDLQLLNGNTIKYANKSNEKVKVELEKKVANTLLKAIKEKKFLEKEAKYLNYKAEVKAKSNKIQNRLIFNKVCSVLKSNNTIYSKAINLSKDRKGIKDMSNKELKELLKELSNKTEIVFDIGRSR